VRSSYPGRYDLYAGQTPGQTVGPFFCQGLVRIASTFQSSQRLPGAQGLCRAERDVIHHLLADASTPGERLRIEGTVYDGLGRPIPDALVEVWQADAQGRYAHPLQLGERSQDSKSGSSFSGFGRCASDDSGRFCFETIRPGAVPGPGGAPQAPHLNVVLGARGLPRLAFTRIYFAGDPALGRDPVLACVPEARRATLLARLVSEGAPPRLPQGAAPGAPDGSLRYVFDIHLQGERETVFFDF
jgi:protocatechuate 3,4-dioxygenase alpha subunit